MSNDTPRPILTGAPYGYDTEGALLCPDCSHGYMHLELVMVHARREDSPGVDIVVQAQTGDHRVFEEMSKNITVPGRPVPVGMSAEDAALLRLPTPSSTQRQRVGQGIVPGPIWGGRRDHTILQFSCENCSGVKEMRFEQYKGTTYAGWAGK